MKVEIALVKGKKLHDKRDAIRDRDLKREADREMRTGGSEIGIGMVTRPVSGV